MSMPRFPPSRTSTQAPGAAAGARSGAAVNALRRTTSSGKASEAGFAAFTSAAGVKEGQSAGDPRSGKGPEG